MPALTNPKIVYLFGAGATHAEIVELHQAKSASTRLSSKAFIRQAGFGAMKRRIVIPCERRMS
jgi:hypothetical protein